MFCSNLFLYSVFWLYLSTKFYKLIFLINKYFFFAPSFMSSFGAAASDHCHALGYFHGQILFYLILVIVPVILLLKFILNFQVLERHFFDLSRGTILDSN